MDKNKNLRDVPLEQDMKTKIITPGSVRFVIVCYDKFNRVVFEINKDTKDILDALHVMVELKKKYENKKTNTVPVFDVYCYDTKIEPLEDTITFNLNDKTNANSKIIEEMKSAKALTNEESFVRVRLNLPKSPYTPEKNEKK